MTTLVAEFLLQSLTIIVAGTFLAKFADALGDRLGLGRTLAGMLLMGIATSLPELVVGCSAAMIDAPDLAVGDLLGSCVFNLFLLAVLDLVYRSGGKLFSHEAAAHGLSAASVILLTGIVLLFIQLPESIELGPIGLGSVMLGLAYMGCARMIFYDQRYQLANAQPAESDDPLANQPPQMKLVPALLGYLALTGVVFVAAWYLTHTADEIVKQTGLGSSIVGTILLAGVTSLPEITTTRAALRIGAFDLAVGNIFGSNSFNIVILIFVDGFYHGPLFSSIGSYHAITCAAIIIITSVALLGLLFQAERRLWLLEYDAALIAILSLGSFILIGLMH
ncbi:sodium:calcium antiporter [Thalassoroseus pseudoceratinae]|uniref:sodium:calcium antiporter n=1 Tax=Thalassoroseus pseudoceratinae TaxID=2713176 RepID=UPI001422CCCC|nr:hypothetical protein [Thalassoroseus pseudoceratinae]